MESIETLVRMKMENLDKLFIGTINLIKGTTELLLSNCSEKATFINYQCLTVV